ncbi:MAG TPA: hypothetical protein VFS18_02225 [Actinomycetota bacterium]|nr:hypothetical protein [Actinomycetota bacterium]
MTASIARRSIAGLGVVALLLVGLMVVSARSAETGRPKCNGVEATIVGTGNGEEIDGTGGRDVIVGRGGNDEIDGAGGGDIICGGRGRDDLDGERGNDKLYGGRGTDHVEGGLGDDLCRGEHVEECER